MVKCQTWTCENTTEKLCIQKEKTLKARLYRSVLFFLASKICEMIPTFQLKPNIININSFESIMIFFIVCRSLPFSYCCLAAGTDAASAAAADIMELKHDKTCVFKCCLLYFMQ
jgi:hypothetical protein